MINQANPVGAFLQGRGMAQQQQAQQQQMDLRSREFGMRETEYNQGQQDRELERQAALLEDIGRGAAWVLGAPQEGEPQTPQERFAVMQGVYRPIFGDMVDSVTLDQLPVLQAQIQAELQGGAPAGLREHDRYLQDLQSDDPQRRRAAEIALGMTARAGGGGQQLVRIRGRDGAERIGSYNPQTGGLMIQTGQGWAEAGPDAQIIGAFNQPQQGAPQSQPQQGPQVTGDMLVTRTPEEQAGLTETSTVNARNEAERQANVIPSYRAARYSIDQMAQFADTARMLLEHPGLESAVGFGGEQVALIPGTPAADAAAILDNLRNRAFLSALSSLRQASQTGSGVGAVSEAEGMRFENAYASLDQAQSPEQFRRELEALIRIAEDSQSLIRDAYDYEYGDIPRAPALPEVGAPSARRGGPRREQPGGGQGGQQDDVQVGDVVDGYRYLGGDKANPNSWERI